MPNQISENDLRVLVDGSVREDLDQTVEQLEPGRTLLLEGTLSNRGISLEGKRGTESAPITIAGARQNGRPPGRIDGRISYHQFHAKAEYLVQRTAAQWDERRKRYRYPGLYDYADRALISLIDCEHIVIKDLEIVRFWPTLIYMKNCKSIHIDGCSLEDGTFAIYAEGESTSDLRVTRCSWVQDTTRHRLWRVTGWDAVHGDRRCEGNAWDKERGAMLLSGGARAFDGAFFRSRNIRGDVEISKNTVLHACNGVHMFNRSTPDPDLNNNVRISENTFRYIRDNVIEPERGAVNWWVYGNQIENAHKWFSLEVKRYGYFYIFANRGWFTEKPGPYGDEYTGGAVFKFGFEHTDNLGPTHVFNNSWYLRSSYIKKHHLHGLKHFNNAIAYCDPIHHEGAGCEPYKPIFGSGFTFPNATEEKQDQKKPGKRYFRRDWEDLGISFQGDLVRHWEFPSRLRSRGYPVERGIGADPGFEDPVRGDFGLRKDSPCLASAIGFEIDMPDGSVWPLPAGADKGCHQSSNSKIKWPPYVPSKKP